MYFYQNIIQCIKIKGHRMCNWKIIKSYFKKHFSFKFKIILFFKKAKEYRKRKERGEGRKKK